MKHLWPIVFVTLFALPAAAAPTKLAQQGRILDGEGAPLEDTHLMVFVLYDAATDGTTLWTEERSADFAAGYYSITLGEEVPLDDLLFTAESVWLELSIDGETLAPRQEVVSVPYALRATAAEHVEGGMVDAAEISVDGTVVIDASGNWVGPVPAVGWADVADIPADIADGDQDTDTLAGLACAEGQLPKWDAASSLWICGDDIDTDTTDTNTDVLAGLPCADGYIAKFDGPSGLWNCAVDADSFADLAGICLPGDIPVMDPVSGTWICGTDSDTVTTTLPWSSVSGIPADLADGDQDTQLTSVPWNMLTGVPAGLDDGDQDTVTTSLPWSAIAGIPADIADGDQDTVDPNTDVLAALPCTDGQIASYQAATSSWVCMDLATIVDQDGDGVLAWNDCNDTDATLAAVADDADCDGVLAAADCDDTDPTVSVPDGQTAACAAASCKAIADAGLAGGDGVYWLNPTGISPFQANCDMSTDGGGWTEFTGAILNAQGLVTFSQPAGGSNTSAWVTSDAFDLDSQSGGDATLRADAVLPIVFTELFGSWTVPAESGHHADDNQSTSGWGGSAASCNGWVLFGTTNSLLKVGSEWGGDFNATSQRVWTQAQTTVSATDTLRWENNQECAWPAESVQVSGISLFIR